MKGQNFTVSMVAIDQVNHNVNATIHSSLLSNVGRLGENQAHQSIGDTCTNLTFSVFSPNISEELVLYANGPCKDALLSQRRVKV